MYFVVVETTKIFFFIISNIIKSNQRKRDRELIDSVSSLNRGTSSERSLIFRLLKKEFPPITIYHDLIIKKDNDEY